MGTLTGKVAVVTGAARGIGEAYAERLHALGADVVLADINLAPAQQVVDRLNATATTSKALALGVDVTSSVDVERFRDDVIAAFGRVDILVNNAAYYAGYTRAPVAELTDAEWDKMITVNVTGVFKVSRAFLPLLTERGGTVVNQSSAAAFVAGANSSHYCASKAAVVSFTRSLAVEVGEAGVRVNAIAPGFILTDASLENFGEEFSSTRNDSAPLRHGGHAADLCGALEFLCTDQSAWMTGQTIVVDGGRVFPQ